MAVRWQDAIRVGRALIGTPYSELDCINFIKKVIRTAPGGVPTYTTAGTNSLWDSHDASSKYKDLTWRQEGIAGARAGMIGLMRRSADDEFHAGLITDVGTILHSAESKGGVVETPFVAKDGWDLLAIHRYITTAGNTEEETTMYKARVDLDNENSSLNLRNGPSSKDRVIGSILHGALVDVLAEGKEWTYVRYNGKSGYVSTPYLERVAGEPEAEPVENIEQFTTIINAEGTAIRLAGVWRVAED